MPQNEILQTLSNYKDVIGLILTGSVTHIFNKIRKGEKITMIQSISHLVIGGFVGLIAYFVLQYLGIYGPMQGIIIGMSSYLALPIIDAIDMVKAKTIYDFFIDFLKFKIGKK